MSLRLVSCQPRAVSRDQLIKRAFDKWTREINAENKRCGLIGLQSPTHPAGQGIGNVNPGALFHTAIFLPPTDND